VKAALLATLALATTPAHAAETVLASYYGAESGTRTASGQRFRPEGMTAAHPRGGKREMPFGTRLRVCLGERCVVVTVNDVGPAKWTRRGLDLSHGAARVIGLVGPGVARVTMERL
jgi:rare lipoprotein A